MTSAYLAGADLASFGVPTATAAQVQAASGIVDGFLQKPAGCVYDPVALQMVSSGAPIVEMPRSRNLMVSYQPLAQVISITYLLNGVWTAVPWSYGFTPEGEIFEEPCGYGAWFGAWRERRIQVTYLAGWPQANLPFAIKQAVANIINAEAQVPTTAFSSAKAGDTQFTRASNSLIDDDTKLMLAPYRRNFAW